MCFSGAERERVRVHADGDRRGPAPSDREAAARRATVQFTRASHAGVDLGAGWRTGAADDDRDARHAPGARRRHHQTILLQHQPQPGADDDV